jgi:hypothetical protein
VSAIAVHTPENIVGEEKSKVNNFVMELLGKGMQGRFSTVANPQADCQYSLAARAPSRPKVNNLGKGHFLCGVLRNAYRGLADAARVS